MIVERCSTGDAETKLTFVASDRELRKLHLQSAEYDVAVESLQQIMAAA